jgi:hypothetical protein
MPIVFMPPLSCVMIHAYKGAPWLWVARQIGVE